MAVRALASVEGFIRQIPGWRESVRGICWTQMPEDLERDALDAREELPAWYDGGRASSEADGRDA
jgi:deoxyribodipyrimidine photolyase-related protein